MIITLLRFLKQISLTLWQWWTQARLTRGSFDDIIIGYSANYDKTY